VSLARLPGADFLHVLQESPGRAALAVFYKIIKNIRDTNDRFIAHKVSQEKLSLVGEMAGSIVHDLRGPYTGIQLAVEMIRENHGHDPETAELCQLVTEQIRRSVGMLDEILQFARGVTKLNRERVLASDLVDRFQRLNREFLAQASVELVDRAIPDPVDVDPDKMLRVLQNLVNNAVEAFAGRGGKVTIEARREDGRVVLLVGDDGPGIPEAIRARVFQPFVTHGKQNGTGLGMAITRSIVEAHGGRISFETATGRGTTFRISLPLAAA
jgi:signal transduction histidine kinase